MFSISYLFAILSGLALFVFGYLLSNFLKGKSKDWKVQFDELNKENQALNKKLNKEHKSAEQFRHKSESWKQEYQGSIKELQDLKKEMTTATQAHEEQLSAATQNYNTLKTEKERAVTTAERLQREVDKLKEKYKRDVADGKEWRSERQSLERTLKSTTDKLEKTTTIAEDYKGKYAEQAAKINKIRVMERELRVLNTKTKKLEEDVAYWEKKHYDTHHELAELKKREASLVSEYNELESLRKGDEILKGNLMSQIQEFKTKFVDINNKYRSMVENN